MHLQNPMALNSIFVKISASTIP